MKGHFLDAVRKAARERILYLPHALDAMNAPVDVITPDEVRKAIFQGEVIEDYPEDVRGHSCLIIGTGNRNRPIHVVCSPKDDFLAIITVYVPDQRRWESDWKTRKAQIEETSHELPSLQRPVETWYNQLYSQPKWISPDHRRRTGAGLRTMLRASLH